MHSDHDMHSSAAGGARLYDLAEVRARVAARMEYEAKVRAPGYDPNMDPDCEVPSYASSTADLFMKGGESAARNTNNNLDDSFDNQPPSIISSN